VCEFFVTVRKALFLLGFFVVGLVFAWLGIFSFGKGFLKCNVITLRHCVITMLERQMAEM
jgi:hypothetical protein